jgi:Holliday junction resolvase RusA-like endonuclease
MRDIRLDLERVTFVPGHARPKGSLRPQQVKDGAGELTGRVRLVDTPHSTRWRRTVSKHVAALGWPSIDEAPCEVNMTFWFDPAAVGASRAYVDAHSHPVHPHIGDLDKLVRNVLDALQDAGVYANDRQVVRVVADKVWAEYGCSTAGLGLRVAEL